VAAAVRLAGRCLALTLVIGLVASASATAAVSGTVLAWGVGGNGELGNGAKPNGSDVPVSVSLPPGVTVKSIASGELDSYAVLSNGRVMVWGVGTLGNGKITEETDVPVEVSGLSGVIAISAEGNHTLALRENGTVVAWGNNTSGQVGSGSSELYIYTPVAVKGLSEVTAISAGQFDSMALLKDGKVMAWGGNYSGELGDGTQTERYVPVEVKGLTNVTAIATGWEDSLAAREDGTVMVWGNNLEGQLGIGTHKGPEKCNNGDACSTVPVEVSGLGGVVAVATSLDDSMALRENGSVADWGINIAGDLGDAIDRSRPLNGHLWSVFSWGRWTEGAN